MRRTFAAVVAVSLAWLVIPVISYGQVPEIIGFEQDGTLTFTSARPRISTTHRPVPIRIYCRSRVQDTTTSRPSGFRNTLRRSPALHTAGSSEV